MDSLSHKKKIVAAAPNCQDFLDFLHELISYTADIRTNVGANDSVDLRRAISAYLQDALDDIKRIRNTQLNRDPAGHADDFL